MRDGPSGLNWLDPITEKEMRLELEVMHNRLKAIYVTLRDAQSTICAGQVATAGMLLLAIVTHDLDYEKTVQAREAAMASAEPTEDDA